MELFLFHAVVASLGLAAVAVVFALLELILRNAPVDAFRVGVAALACVLCLPVLHVAAEASGLSDTFRAGLAARAAAGVSLAEPIRSARVSAGGEPRMDGEPTDLVSLMVGLLGAAQQVARTAPPTESVPVEPSHRESREFEAPSVERIAQEGAWRLDPLALFCAAYGLGAAIALLRLARRLAKTCALLRGARTVDDPLVLAAWKRALSRARVPGARLFVSREVETPACAGLFACAVVLPEDDPLLGRPDALECVLLHELVHLERRDAWTQLGLELLRAVFWFHPAAFWLTNRISALRELACDALVVERAGGRRRYAAVLLEYASLLADRLRAGAGRSAPSVALVPWTRSERRGSSHDRVKSRLTRRIEMLFVKTSLSARPWRAITYSLAAGLFGAVLCGQLALASALGGEGQGEAQAGAAARLVPDLGGARVIVREASPAALGTGSSSVRTSGEDEGGAVRARGDGRVLRFARQDAVPGQKLGVALEGPGPALAAQLGLNEGVGLVVVGVAEGSAAGQAGIARFDVVVAIDGEPATDESLARAKASWNEGRPMELQVVRAGRPTSISVPGVEQAEHAQHASGSDGALRAKERDGEVHARKRAAFVWPDPVQVADAARRLAEGSVDQAVESAGVAIEQLLQRQGLESQGDLARDALEVARHYYAAIDPKTFAREVQRVLPGYLEELCARDVDAQAVLEGVRSALDAVLADPQRFAGALRKSIGVPAPPAHPGHGLHERAAPQDGNAAQSNLDRLRAELGTAMQKIQAQMRDLELLHQRVQELAERQGAK